MPLFGPVIRSLRKDVIKALREENERLKAEWEMPCQRCEGYRNERDEARAANEKLRAHAGRVEQRELAALADLDEARAEVARLEGLILDAVRKCEGRSVFLDPSAIFAEARRILGSEMAKPKRCPLCRSGADESKAPDGRPMWTCSRCGHRWTDGKA